MLGVRIGELRRDMGLSQAELGRRLGVSASTVGMYEQGRREPGVDMLVTMSDLFGVSTDYLLTGKTGPAEEQTIARILEVRLASAQQRLSRRSDPLSNQELAVLLAALLTNCP